MRQTSKLRKHTRLQWAGILSTSQFLACLICAELGTAQSQLVQEHLGPLYKSGVPLLLNVPNFQFLFSTCAGVHSVALAQCSKWSVMIHP